MFRCVSENSVKSAYFFALIAIAGVLAFGSGLVLAEIPDETYRPQILVDVETGEVLSHQMAFRRWAPASLTKLMTVYTVFHAIKSQHIGPDSPVRVSEHALMQPPTKMGFPIGTILTVETALKIIMARSANDIAVALGEAVTGSEPDFVGLMNRHAQRLGMANTVFTNANGLPDSAQYTTARDMAVLSLALTREFPLYDSFFNIPAIQVNGRRLRNYNALLERFAGTNGMKTGYVCASGFNISVRVKRQGRTLIAVVLGGKSGLTRNVRVAKLLQEGFDGYFKEQRQVLSKFSASHVSDPVPEDITSETCPKKYADMRKAENGSHSENYDWVNRQVMPERSLALAYASVEPGRVPDYISGKAPVIGLASPVKAGAAESVPEDLPPSLAELEMLYLAPRRKTGAGVKIVLGGATGLNPTGLRLDNGNTPSPIIPVPVKRPESEGQGD